MRKQSILANLLLLLGTASSNLDWIAGYDPLTYVVDHAAIDLDQREIEKWLDVGIFQQAEKIYTKGGHSQSFARLRLLNAAPPAAPFPPGTLVYGLGVNGDGVQGRLLHTTTWINGDEAIIDVEYDREKILDRPSYCQVGALALTDSALKNGCFVEAGEIQVLHYARNTPAYTYNYTYDVNKDNVNGRTIMGFSTNALDEMWNCTTCPYETFNKYVNYYGMPDYGHRLILAALDGARTKFQNGNLDFSEEKRPVRAEMVKIATKFMNVWMYTIRMMEHAIDECELPCEKKGDVLYAEAQKAHCSDSPVRAWDQAVAFYAGSLEGSSGLGEGIMFFGLADNMCSRFLTCGDDADLRFGVSNVNNVAINQFLDGQLHLLGRDCEQARQSKNKIVTIMTVPLVQATLLNAYEQVYGVKHAEAGQAKMAIQGTSYAATVLPLVHDCSPKDAQIIYENLLFGRDENNQTKVPDFVAVKDAFERNYRCMGITCKSVGGIWEGREYFPHASPCQDAIVTESSRSNRHRISIPVAATVAVLAACAMLNNLLRNRKKAADMENRDVQTPEPNFFPHIAEPSRELD